MPKGAFLCVSVGTGFELVRLIPGENMPPGEHRISPSNSARSFHFGPKTQIAAHHPVYREGRRIPDFKNSSLNFQIEKIIGTRSSASLRMTNCPSLQALSLRPASRNTFAFKAKCTGERAEVFKLVFGFYLEFGFWNLEFVWSFDIRISNLLGI